MGNSSGNYAFMDLARANANSPVVCACSKYADMWSQSICLLLAHYHPRMTLKESNPYLRDSSEAARKAALRISAKTSSAVEGIHSPFAEDMASKVPANREAFVAYWQQRAVKVKLAADCPTGSAV
jgi:hypothetical protein